MKVYGVDKEDDFERLTNKVKKAPPTIFFPVTSTNVILTNWYKISSLYLVPVLNY